MKENLNFRRRSKQSESPRCRNIRVSKLFDRARTYLTLSGPHSQHAAEILTGRLRDLVVVVGSDVPTVGKSAVRRVLRAVAAVEICIVVRVKHVQVKVTVPSVSALVFLAASAAPWAGLR